MNKKERFNALAASEKKAVWELINGGMDPGEALERVAPAAQSTEPEPPAVSLARKQAEAVTEDLEPSTGEKVLAPALVAAGKVGFGLAPKAAGALNVARGTIASVPALQTVAPFLGALAREGDAGKSIGELYKEGAEHQRGEQAAAEEVLGPGGTFASEVGGEALGLVGNLPGKIPAQGLKAIAKYGAKAGALGGALTGAGDEGEFRDIAGGALLGTGLGVAAPVAGAVLPKLRDVLAKPIHRAGARADEKRVLTAIGKAASINSPGILRDMLRVPGGVKEGAKVMRETGMSRGITATPSSVFEKAQHINKEANRVVGEIIEAADKGGGVVSGDEVANDLFMMSNDILKASKGTKGLLPENAAIVKELQDMSQVFRGAGDMTMREAQTMIAGRTTEKGAPMSGLSESVNWARRAQDLPSTIRGAVSAEAIGVLRDKMRGAADQALTGQIPADIAASPIFKGRAPKNAADLYRKAQRISQVSQFVERGAGDALGRADVRAPLSLSDVTLLSGGDAAQAVGVVNKAMRPFMMGAGATWAEVARALADQLMDPRTTQGLGERVPNILLQASALGGDSLRDLYVQLTGEDPLQGPGEIMGKLKAKVSSK